MSLFIESVDLFVDQNASPKQELKINEDSNIEVGQNENKSEPGTPKPNPMAFTIDFGDSKEVDKSRLEKLAKKSQARHQRVQSMSASLTRSSPIDHKPPLSAKLPRKAQGYNSEGYFSSDQEDSILSGSVKLRQTLIAAEKINLKSPVNETIQNRCKTSRSPIVDSIMSRSDILPSKQNLNLPLKHINSSYKPDVHRTSSYSNLWPSNQSRYPMTDIIDQSPEGVMLNDISSPEYDLLTPDNCLSTPDVKSPYRKQSLPSSATPELFPIKNKSLYIDDDDLECQSNNSSTGTYTIEGDNYTEEQKARMSIDRTFGKSKDDRDPDLIFDYHKTPKDVTILSPKRSVSETPKKSITDGNILEISCCYEPTGKDLAAQTSKQIKSTRSYLEKIKNRVKNITDKTFAKSPPKLEDVGCFTSVTTSGVLNSNKPMKNDSPRYRRCSLTSSDIDQTDYVHRLSRESSVPVNLPSNQLLTPKFESTALRTAHAKLTEDSPEEVVGNLSYLSLNRCKGDKTWIQEWADSVKNYNRNSLQLTEVMDSTFTEGELPPQSPRHLMQERPPRSTNVGLTKIPSPVNTYRGSKKEQIPIQDTEAYLLKTQNAISNLQAKLQSGRSNPSTIPPLLTSSLISEKTAISRLPISQLSRSNSLNYRLRKKDTSNDSSPLRSPGNYVITGSTNVPNTTKILLNNASRSLDDDPNMNSQHSHSSDDKTLSNRPYERKTHVRHKSFDNRNQHLDFNNSNAQVSLKSVLKNQTQNIYVSPRNIDQSHGNPRDGKRGNHQRNFSDTDKALRRVQSPNAAFGMSIKRSSSFSTVNKNNNYINNDRLNSRHNDQDYMSDDSEIDQNKSDDVKHKKNTLRARLDADISSKIQGKCPNTPEMQRKFGPGLVRNSMRVTSRERSMNTRMSEPPMPKEERQRAHHQSRITESTRQAVMNRLTKSRSSTRELQPKSNEKGTKKPAQYRSASALASKEQEFSNWKKRSSYDPMKAALEGRKKQQAAKRQEGNKDDLSSPSLSSPVHRSQSFHSTNLADLDILDSSSEGSEDDQLLCHLPTNHPMINSTHSDSLVMRPKTLDYPDVRPKAVEMRRQVLNNDVVLSRDYVTAFKVNKPPEKLNRRDIDKRKTFILDSDVTPTKDNVDLLRLATRDNEAAIDKRKTFILDSDTNSTTNGSSPRNSSIFSHEKHSLTTATSDTEGESGTESAPVVLRHNKTVNNNPNKRYSGDYSMSSSTTSISQNQKRPKDIQPRYLDISKYKTDNSSKTFLRRDPSKTYVGVLNNNNYGNERSVSKGSAQQIEMEQKKQELEKWKRRASYDPRKAAALGKSVKTPPKTASYVLRSQSFHGPVLTSAELQLPAASHDPHDQSSDNDF